MNKYIIYTDESGSTFSMMIPEGYSDDEVKTHIKNNGGAIARESAIIGSSEDDAVNRYSQAAKWLKEGKQIGSPENVKRVQDKVQADEVREEEDADRERTRIEAVAYQNQEPSATGAKALLKQMGRSVPKMVTSAYEAIVNPDPDIGRVQTFADRYQMPYENDLAQQIAGDPTLVPSMLIPGIGEAKIASVAGKIIPKVLKGGKAERYLMKPTQELAKKIIDNTVQSAVFEAPDAIDGRGDARDVATGMLAGTGIGSGLELAGKAGKAFGRKVVQSTVKPKIESAFDADALLDATNPNGSNVIKPFSSIGQIFSQMDNGVKKWTEKQAEAIPEGNSNTLELINRLRYKYKQEFNSGSLTPAKYEKKIAVLDEQEQVLSRNADIGEDIRPAETDLEEYPLYENANKNDAEKYRYKVEFGRINKLNQRTKKVELFNGEMTKEQRKRSAQYPYPKFYKEIPVEQRPLPNEPTMLDEFDIREIITKPEKRTPYIKTPNKNIHNAKVSSGKDARFTMENMSLSDPTKREVYRDIYGGLSDILGGPIDNPTPYREATQAMAPLMASRKDVSKAVDRIDKLNIIPLTSAILAGQGLTSDDPRLGALGLLPMLTQGTRIGTSAYRIGQRMPELSRYAIPLGIRASED
jgi:hypothetical protein